MKIPMNDEQMIRHIEGLVNIMMDTFRVADSQFSAGVVRGMVMVKNVLDRYDKEKGNYELEQEVYDAVEKGKRQRSDRAEHLPVDTGGV